MIDTYSKEDLKVMSMQEIAYLLLSEEKQPMPFEDIVKKVAKARKMSNDEVNERLAQFYTDINIDGRFVCIGDNQWGLKVWYPVESSEEELATTIKPKKRKKTKAKAVENDELDDLEEDINDDFDDLDDDEFLDEDLDNDDEFDDIDDEYDDDDEED